MQLKISDVGHSAKDDDRQAFLKASQWKYCRLSNKRLELPVVSDYKGHLFTKEAILEWLLTPDREDYNEDQVTRFSHIQKLNDVVELRNLSQVGSNEGDYPLKCDYDETILGRSASRMVYLVPCGDVLPSTALKVSATMRCPKCDHQFTNTNVITINPSLKDAQAQEDRIEKIKDTHHHNGTSRKRPKRKRGDVPEDRRKKAK